MFRVQAAVELEGILLGVNYYYVTGKPYAAQTRVFLPQGRQVIYIEPLGTRRLADSGILDLRVTKIFRFGEAVRLEVLGDVLNLTNDQAPQNILSTEFDNSSFQQPTLWPSPRRLRIGAKLVF